MPDRNKVIKGLEYCEEYFNCCDKCPYWDGGTHCTADLAHDAINLLKEQEDVVLCKDCKKCGFDDCPVYGWMPEKAFWDWYCADGERRDDDD